MPATLVLQHRRESAAQWTSVNPALAEGEIGYENDTAKFKIGRRKQFTSAISSIANSSGTVTITLGTAINTNVLLQVGDSITISGVTPSGYNGTFTVTAVNAAAPSTISFANATTDPMTVAGTVVYNPLLRWNHPDMRYQGALDSVTAPIALADGVLSLTYGDGLTVSSNTLKADFGTSGATKVLNADHNGNQSTTAAPIHGLGNNSRVVGTTDVQELSNKSFVNFVEKFNVVAGAPAATTTIDTSVAAAWYYTSNATTNYTLNFTSTTPSGLNNVLAVGQSMTVTVMHTNGSTAFFPNAFQVDGTAVTPKWQVSAPPEAGDVNSINSYTFTILKTAATPTYAVFASQSRFD